MKFRYRLSSTALLLAGLGIGAASALPAQSSLPQTDWTARVTVTKIGGHKMGSPLAKQELIEYISYSCNHCASFETSSHDEIKADFVSNAKISIEVRNFVRDPVDLTAAMLARCGGKDRFFGNHHALLSSQSTWLPKAFSATKETQQSWFTGDYQTRMKNIATYLGFYPLMAKRGFSKSQVDACFADQDAQKKIVAMTNYGGKTMKITGTPSFTLNGKLLDKVHGWPRLKAELNKKTTTLANK